MRGPFNESQRDYSLPASRMVARPGRDWRAAPSVHIRRLRAAPWQTKLEQSKPAQYPPAAPDLPTAKTQKPRCHGNQGSKGNRSSGAFERLAADAQSLLLLCCRVCPHRQKTRNGGDNEIDGEQ